MTPRYDTIGRVYSRHRRPDPRIEAQIHGALGDARTVLNVGAGTGSYEPTDRVVIALEPSAVMIVQRRPDAAPVVLGRAETLRSRTARTARSSRSSPCTTGTMSTRDCASSDASRRGRSS